MDEQEYERLGDAVRTLGRKLAQNRTVNHMSSVSLHLHAINCGHTDIPHICMTVDVDDPALLDHEKLEIPRVWEGVSVYISQGKVVFAGTSKTESFEENWFDPDSYDHTLKAVLRTVDPDFIAGVCADEFALDKFAEDLYHEIRFLAPYDLEEQSRVLDYIHTHKEELYQYTLEHFLEKAKK